MGNDIKKIDYKLFAAANDNIVYVEFCIYTRKFLKRGAWEQMDLSLLDAKGKGRKMISEKELFFRTKK